MSQPTKYTQNYDYSDELTTTQVPGAHGAHLDTEFAEIKATTDEIIDNLALIQRDDGALANASVGNDQLKDEVVIGLNPAGDWETATAYAANDAVWNDRKLYKCLVAHTSGTFATDLSAAKWEELVDFDQYLTVAETKADEAEASAAAAAASEANVESIYDSFDDRYLGAKASDPTFDNDGNALIAGALYWNTAESEMRVYDLANTTWRGLTSASIAVQRFSGDGTETEFVLASAPASKNNTQAYVSGVYQQKDSYSVSGATLTFSGAPPSGTDNIEVMTISTLNIGEPSDGTVTAAKISDNSSEQTAIVTKLGLPTSSGASLVGFSHDEEYPDGTLGAKAKQSVCFADAPYGAAVGSDATAAIQAALDSGASEVYGADGTFTTAGTLTVSTAGQRVILPPGCTINLDTSTVTHKAFDVQADGASVEGGKITTTLRTLNFLVKLAGENAKLRRSTLYYATKSTIEPIDGTDIPYNRGGVEMRGDGAEVYDCDIYNQEGAAVVTYADRMIVRNNRLHDNVLGIHASIESGETTERTVYITGNKIYDNDVNHAEGADGILTSIYTNAIITDNEITGSGEHGAYIYSRRSTVSNNRATGNYRVGLKVKSVYNTSVTGNICQDNNTEGAGTNGELELQVQTENVNDILIANNVCHGANSSGLKVAYVTDSLTCERVVFDSNVCDTMGVSFSSDVVVSNNKVSGTLTVGEALATAPTTQSNALITGNSCATLNIGRCTNSTIADNVMGSFNSGSNTASANNTIRGNRMTAQATQISRNSFSVFSDNYVDCTSLATTLLVQGSNSTQNSFKQIIGNRFIAHAARVIDDTSSSNSGNKNVIANNVFDSATDGISLWGSGHTVTGNTNISTGGVGFVGMNDSWLIGNSPIVSLRSGTTGNVVY